MTKYIQRIEFEIFKKRGLGPIDPQSWALTQSMGITDTNMSRSRRFWRNTLYKIGKVHLRQAENPKNPKWSPFFTMIISITKP